MYKLKPAQCKPVFFITLIAIAGLLPEHIAAAAITVALEVGDTFAAKLDSAVPEGDQNQDIYYPIIS